MLAQIGRKVLDKTPNWLFARLWSFWPPFFGAGIKIDFIAKDYKIVDVSMSLKIRNTNYVGTHFGGSLYAMTDPFFMMMLMSILGRDYIVWDKAAEVRFKKPGLGKVRAKFIISDDDITNILNNINSHPDNKFDFIKSIEITNEQGETVCEVKKTIYIKKKPIEKSPLTKT